MSDSALTVALTVAGTLLGAVVGVFGSLLVARHAAKDNLVVEERRLQGELTKIKQQESDQQAVLERERIAELRQRYLVPLSYYAERLSVRIGELELQLEKAKQWFESARDYLEDPSEETERRLGGPYAKWFYYKGYFAQSTLFYTCSYFYYAREVRFNRPFDESRNVYAQELREFLNGVEYAFWRNDADHGLWDTAQEMIGERFGKGGVATTFVEMCQEHLSGDMFRRAVYLRPLDFYRHWLDAEWAHEIKTSLDKLIEFLKHDPQTYGIPADQEADTGMAYQPQ